MRLGEHVMDQQMSSFRRAFLSDEFVDGAARDLDAILLDSRDRGGPAFSLR